MEEIDLLKEDNLLPGTKDFSIGVDILSMIEDLF
jgi:hypothetical protein